MLLSLKYSTRALPSCTCCTPSIQDLPLQCALLAHLYAHFQLLCCKAPHLPATTPRMLCAFATASMSPHAAPTCGAPTALRLICWLSATGFMLSIVSWDSWCNRLHAVSCILGFNSSHGKSWADVEHCRDSPLHTVGETPRSWPRSRDDLLWRYPGFAADYSLAFAATWRYTLRPWLEVKG